jgi:hypothetical protein
LAVLRIADKWLENRPLPNATVFTFQNFSSVLIITIRINRVIVNISLFTLKNPNTEYRNGLSVQVGTGKDTSPILNKKSPSFHSNRSENMSMDGAGEVASAGMDTTGDGIRKSSSGALLNSPGKITLPSYEDHWTYEQIILERVGFTYMIFTKKI